MIPSARAVLTKARTKHFALPAFNVSTVEQIRVVAEVATKLKAPVIIETSEGEASLITYPIARAVVTAWQKVIRIPLILNADHHHDFARLKQAIQAGCPYVHIDASGLEYKDNVALTQKVVKLAHSRGVLVEGELGRIGGGSWRHKGRAKFSKTDLTDPEQAINFVKQTKIDSLAANIGNIHGLWSGGKPHLSIDHVRKMRRAMPKVFLTLHGGSGIPDKEVRQAIKAGITKVNINTELRVAFIGGLRQSLRQQPLETTPLKIYPPAMAAMAKVVASKIKLCGADGQWSK
jgi:tagatose 1,6-diphosphate aldolase GatY/KbaY